MKTQIIQLEEYDDNLSVRDKMEWSQTPRILLVWPQKGKILRNRLDLILLERVCSSHGSQLAIATKDPEVRFQARAAGIPVFSTRQQAQVQPWGKSFREFRRQELLRYKAEHPEAGNLRREDPLPRKTLPLWNRITFFTLGVIAVLSIASTLLPSAEIILLPEAKQRSLTVPFQAQPGGTGIGISGTVPGRSLQIQVNGQLSRPTTGTIPIPSQYAQGTVVFTNLGQESVFIPLHTILSTGGEDPILFQTLKSAQTPQGTQQQIEVAVEALYPGASGNVAQNEINLINLEQGAELSVTNPEPTTGGTDMLIPAPDQQDRADLSQELNRILKEKARQQAASSLDPGDLLLTSKWDDFELIDETYTPSQDSPGDTLWLERTLRFQVYYASNQDLHALAQELLDAQYEQNSYQLQEGSITLQNLSKPVLNDEMQFTWQVRISWKEIQVMDQTEIIQWIEGKKASDAAALLQEKLELASPPQIQIHPGIWHRIPILPFRIAIELGEINHD